MSEISSRRDHFLYALLKGTASAVPKWNQKKTALAAEVSFSQERS
jgi:hypothetical protein